MMIRKLIVCVLIVFVACAPKPKLKIHSYDKYDKPLYRLGFGDVIEMKFFDNDRFNREMIIRPDGRITLEKIGDILVAGLTTQQVDSVITECYKDILKIPDVTIFLKYFSNHKVYVLGEVNHAGSYKIEKGMSVVHAIAVAGGLKRKANKKSILLIRKNKHGKIAAARINLHDILTAQSNAVDLQIQALDIIYVPKTFIGNVDAFTNQLFDLILPPMDIFWRLWFMEQMNNE